jgi:hypothetical protein
VSFDCDVLESADGRSRLESDLVYAPIDWLELRLWKAMIEEANAEVFRACAISNLLRGAP